jgi:hypothetical protein
VTPRLPTTPLELNVAFTTSAIYVQKESEWIAIPAGVAAARRTRIAPIPSAPGNVTLDLEDVGMGTSFRYCR